MRAKKATVWNGLRRTDRWRPSACREEKAPLTRFARGGATGGLSRQLKWMSQSRARSEVPSLPSIEENVWRALSF